MDTSSGCAGCVLVELQQLLIRLRLRREGVESTQSATADGERSSRGTGQVKCFIPSVVVVSRADV